MSVTAARSDGGVNSDIEASAVGFAHPALFYADMAGYLAATVAFITAGLDAGEPVMVAVPGPNLDRIEAELGGRSEQVRTADMTVAGRNPGRIIGSVLSAFADEHRGRRVRVIGEPIWAGRSTTEYPACVQHEALINVAFAGRAATILCPYDTRQLAPQVLLDAARTHPVLIEGASETTSRSYADPLKLAAGYNESLPEPDSEADVEVLVFDAAIGARGVRRFVHDRAVAAGLSPDRVSAIRCAVGEVALNTIMHTAHPGIVLVWVQDAQLVCEVKDSGVITDPLVGRRVPAPHDGAGSGLFLVNSLCDLVRSHHGEHGSTTRMYMRVAA
ncbi:MAG TPA: sensor histidine kinase [Pseudonocardia sp.]